MARQKKVKRPKKRVILFIVEGRSDMAALERPIQTLLADNEQGIQATFLIAECDVTSDRRNNPDNIEQKINRFYFEPFFSANDFCYPKDVLEVVHICDLDGTFIPDENCRVYDSEHEVDDGFVYDPPFIYGETAETVQERNHNKAANIRHLLTLETIKVGSKTCPYSVYFFSSNIDHYLHDKLNLLGHEKISRAEEFADKCDEDPTWFIRRICNHSQALKNMTLEESWTYITEGCNSIKRHTNFNIYIDKLVARLNESPEEEE